MLVKDPLEKTERNFDMALDYFIEAQNFGS